MLSLPAPVRVAALRAGSRAWRRNSRVLILSLAYVAVANVAGAQTVPRIAPWTVTVAPSMDPLPIGFCGAVRLTLFDPATKDVPRRPSGIRVPMADFDLTVSSPNPSAVAGEFLGANFFQVCACQVATIGAVATITATYPAQSLAPPDRVRGVALQSTATLTFSASKGEGQPSACGARQATTLVTAATPTTAGLGGAPVSATGRTASGAPVALPSQRVPARAPTLTPVPVGQPVATEPAAVGTAVPTPAVSSTATKTAANFPTDVTVVPILNANGSFSDPGSVTLTFGLSADGSFSTPGEVTVTFGLSATGNWVGAPASNFPAP